MEHSACSQCAAKTVHVRMEPDWNGYIPNLEEENFKVGTRITGVHMGQDPPWLVAYDDIPGKGNPATRVVCKIPEVFVIVEVIGRTSLWNAKCQSNLIFFDRSGKTE